MVAAAVISIGTVSLPVMLRQGYNPRIAAGVVAAAGGLTQIVPPSLSLIVLADQLGRGVGEMYAAALVPAALIIVAYAVLVALLALLRPQWMPGAASDAAADPRGTGGLGALALLAFAGVAGAWAASTAYPVLTRALGRDFAPPPDERVIVAVAIAAFVAIGAAAADRRFGSAGCRP